MATSILNLTTGVVFLRSITGGLTVSSSIVSGGNIYAGDGQNLGFQSRGYFNATADGIWSLTNNAGTDFTRLMFGGTSSAFPALKRSATLLHCRLADDSAYAGFNCGTFTGSAGTAVPAGGSSSCGLFFSTSAVGLYAGTGAPSVSAAKGSIYVNTTASTTTTRFYVNTDGAGTWTNFTSAA